MGAEIIQPKQTFFQIIEKHGFPSRFARKCCKFLKEYKILDNVVQGIRRAESAKRAARYKEPIICRMYNKKDHVNVYLPILEWTDKDVAEFINEKGIKCHPLYYDEQGNFHVERRLGCMCCPLRSDRGLAHFKANPKYVRLWIKAGAKWYAHLRPSAKSLKYGSVYDVFFIHLFCDSYQDYLEKKYTMFDTLDCKEFLEEFFKIKLD